MNEENFEGLRKLLAVKRHEQPPPGYFDRMPRAIFARISESEKISEGGFWARLLESLRIRPAMAYGFAAAVCATVVGGIGYSLRLDSPQAATAPLREESWNLSNPISDLASKNANQEGLSYDRTGASSTNPVFGVQPPASLFEGVRLRVQPASFSTDH